MLFQCRQIDCEQLCIQQYQSTTDCRTFQPQRTLAAARFCTPYCMQLTKAFVAETSCNQLLIDTATYVLIARTQFTCTLCTVNCDYTQVADSASSSPSTSKSTSPGSGVCTGTSGSRKQLIALAGMLLCPLGLLIESISAQHWIRPDACY